MTHPIRSQPRSCTSAWLPAGALFVVLLPAAAATPEPEVQIARVEVVGTVPFAEGGSDPRLLPYGVQTLGPAALRDNGGGNLVENMARRLHGVNVNEISGSPFQVDLSYRGFRASPILGTGQGLSVYLDGVRVNEPFGDVINWDMLPEAALARLSLLPGSNPLYGLNTQGGAIALETRSGLLDPGGELALSVGENGRRRADLSYGVRGDKGWHAFTAATLFREDGWRDHSDGSLGNLFLKVGQAGERTDWQWTLLGGRSRLLGNGLLPSYRDEDGTLLPGLYEADRRAVYTFPDRTRNRLLQTAFRLQHRFDAATELTASAYVRNSRRDTVGGDVGDEYADYVEDCADGFLADGSPADPDECGLTREEGEGLHPASLNTTSTRQRGRGASIDLARQLGSHRFNVGATWDHSRVDFAQYEQEAFLTPARGVEGDPDEEREPASSVTGTSRAAGLYAAATLALAPATHVTASLRYNHARVGNTLTTEDGHKAPESFTYRRLNPALGLTHARGPLTWFANVSQSNRVPTVIELGCADPAEPCRLPVGLQSDPYLKQVVSRTLEAGLRGGQGRAGFSASLYRTTNRDDILFSRAGASRAGYFSNFARTRHQGADLGAHGEWGALRASADYSYLRATYDADGTLFTGARTVVVTPGTPIAGLPRHTLKLGLDWDLQPGLVLGADLQALSHAPIQGNEDGLIADAEDGEEGRRADWSVRGHVLVNLHARWRPLPGWELFARVNNLFDRRYESFGALAVDMFPNGQLLQPAAGAVAPSPARFVAPGAPRTLNVGVRYRF
ncbi:TonB-dependent receptor [Massilia sp. Mn16-1_5]|uniref:TonB-dependent receptor n=1 Tax=Massilia sp. Mn16-1_5 TaxID=2079199 RepID=UPI00109EBC36|nr:TonB-dependent receptor [Massilia sp. Mn16-1_5]THC39247.1 TonB-dependent receptor [Massilia sp. Mn16-1_5]